MPTTAAAITDVTDDTFESEVLAHPGVVLLDAHATWCGPCRAMAPALADYAADASGVKVVKLDVDDAPAAAQALGIRSVPTLVVFRDGEPLARRVGAATAADLEALVSGATAAA